MFCRKCENKVNENDVFCMKCGNKLEKSNNTSIQNSSLKIDTTKLVNSNSNQFTYISDFIQSLTKKENLGTLVYVIANIILLSMMFMASGDLNPFSSFIMVLVIYTISMTIALSPIGEWMLRVQLGCRKIKRRDMLQRLEPLFNEVYERARELQPSIPNNVSLYISNDMSPNAFATGRKTICVTKGLLQLSDEEIKGILAHEFGHLAHKDTDLLLVISVGNIIVTGLFVVINFILTAFSSSDDDSDVGSSISFVASIANLFVIAFMWIWTTVGALLVNSSSRANEYKADEFAFNLGYGYHLASSLDSFNSCGKVKNGFLRAIHATHPPIDDRIGRLQELGVNY